MFEYTRCNLCNQDRTKVIWQEPPYRIVRCQNCGLIYLNPRPEAKELVQLYSREYFTNYYLKNREERIVYFQRRLEEIEEFKKGESLLDIGCGVGFFLKVAQEFGWQVEGVEPSPFAVRFARTQYGLRVFQGELKEANFSSNFFDLITMWDVLGHLSNPMGYLKEAFHLLKRGGVIVLKVPHYYQAIFLLARFVSHFTRAKGILHLPVQIYHFTPRILTKMVEKAGFRVLKIKGPDEVITSRYAKGFLKNLAMVSFLKLFKLLGKRESFILYATKQS
ncbi:Ubiquinone biosynthesis O-methyltransferase [subsurface metagenome]